MTKEQNLKIALAISNIVQIVDDSTLVKINPYINRILDVADDIGIDETMADKEAIYILSNLIGKLEDNHKTDYDTALRIAIKAIKESEGDV